MFAYHRTTNEYSVKPFNIYLTLLLILILFMAAVCKVKWSTCVHFEFDELQTVCICSVQEKEKELEVRNIYALRQHKPPHRLDNSISSTPVPEVRYVTKLKLHNIHSETQQGFETSPRNEVS
jgi:hypothetical protein